MIDIGTYVTLLNKPKFVLLVNALCNKTPTILWSPGSTFLLIKFFKNALMFFDVRIIKYHALFTDDIKAFFDFSAYSISY
jgi:hypothetical protein